MVQPKLKKGIKINKGGKRLIAIATTVEPNLIGNRNSHMNECQKTKRVCFEKCKLINK